MRELFAAFPIYGLKSIEDIVNGINLTDSYLDAKNRLVDIQIPRAIGKFHELDAQPANSIKNLAQLELDDSDSQLSSMIYNVLVKMGYGRINVRISGGMTFNGNIQESLIQDLFEKTVSVNEILNQIKVSKLDLQEILDAKTAYMVNFHELCVYRMQNGMSHPENVMYGQFLLTAAKFSLEFSTYVFDNHLEAEMNISRMDLIELLSHQKNALSNLQKLGKNGFGMTIALDKNYLPNDFTLL